MIITIKDNKNKYPFECDSNLIFGWEPKEYNDPNGKRKYKLSMYTVQGQPFEFEFLDENKMQEIITTIKEAKEEDRVLRVLLVQTKVQNNY